jgi:hypothetical protein
LMGADALFAGRHQMRGLKPEVQLNLAVLENRSDLDRKFALAGAAAAQANATALDWSNSVKTTAFRAERPIRPDDSFQSGVGCGLVMEVRCGQNGHNQNPLVPQYLLTYRTCQVYNSLN